MILRRNGRQSRQRSVTFAMVSKASAQPYSKVSSSKPKVHGAVGAMTSTSVTEGESLIERTTLRAPSQQLFTHGSTIATDMGRSRLVSVRGVSRPPERARRLRELSFP